MERLARRENLYANWGDYVIGDKTQNLISTGFRSCSGFVLKDDMAEKFGLFHAKRSQILDPKDIESLRSFAGGEIILIEGSETVHNPTVLRTLRYQLGMRLTKTISVDTSSVDLRFRRLEKPVKAFHIAFNPIADEIVITRNFRKGQLIYPGFKSLLWQDYLTQVDLSDITPNTFMFGTLTILIIILTIIITSQNISKKDKNESEKSVLNTSVTKPPTSTTTPTLTPIPSDTPTLTPSSTPTILTPTPQPNSDNQLNLDLKYPNSIIINQNGSETIYESTDDPKKITDWYKDKIKSIGMKATSFVQTNTNGNILNKLVGANQNQEVKIEISKQNNNVLVKIVVVSD